MYEVLLGILERANALDYEIVILPITSKKAFEDENFIANLVRVNDLCALILMGIEKHTLYYEELKKINIPTACIDGDLTSEYVGNVSIDNTAAFLEATDFIIKNMATNNLQIHLLFMSGRKNSIACINRQKGFEDAIRKSDKEIISHVYYGDYSERKSYEIVSMILDQKIKVDAIICANDMMAVGATNAILEKGFSIPKNVQVIGCDNVVIGRFLHPSISTISMNKSDIGFKAVELVHNIMNNTAKQRETIIAHELLLRETTA